MIKKLDDNKFDNVTDKFVDNMTLEDWRDMFRDQAGETIQGLLEDSQTEQDLRDNYPTLYKIYKEVQL